MRRRIADLADQRMPRRLPAFAMEQAQRLCVIPTP